MLVRVRLKEFLEQHQLNPYALARSLEGEVSQTAVYALCRSDRVRRVDLQTLGGVLDALRRLTGQEVGVGDLLVAQDAAPSPRVAALLTAGPVRLAELPTGAFDEEDDEFWQRHRRAQRQLESRG